MEELGQILNNFAEVITFTFNNMQILRREMEVAKWVVLAISVLSIINTVGVVMLWRKSKKACQCSNVKVEIEK